MYWYIVLGIGAAFVVLFIIFGLIAGSKEQKKLMKNKESCDAYFETNNFSYFFKVLRNTTGQLYVKVVIMCTRRKLITQDKRITVVDANVNNKGYYVVSGDIDLYSKGVRISSCNYEGYSNPPPRSRLGLEIDIDDLVIDSSGNIELEIATDITFVAEPFAANEKIGVWEESERIKLKTNKSNIKQVAKTYNFDNISLGVD